MVITRKGSRSIWSKRNLSDHKDFIRTKPHNVRIDDAVIVKVDDAMIVIRSSGNLNPPPAITLFSPPIVLKSFYLWANFVRVKNGTDFSLSELMATLKTKEIKTVKELEEFYSSRCDVAVCAPTTALTL